MIIMGVLEAKSLTPSSACCSSHGNGLRITEETDFHMVPSRWFITLLRCDLGTEYICI